MDPNNSEFVVEDELNESDFTEVSSIGMDMKQMAEKIQKLEESMKNAKGTNVVDQSAGMMQIVWQMGKEIGELKNENEGLKRGMVNMMKAFEELKKANDGLKEENEEKGKEIEGMKKENGDTIAKMLVAFEELKVKVEKLVEENNNLKECMTKMEKDLDGLKAENKELKEESALKSHEIEGMKKAIEELKAGKHEGNRAFQELKEENGRVLKEMAELIAQIGGKNSELERKIVEKDCKIEEFEATFNGLKDAISGKNAELDAQIVGLKKEEEKLKQKMDELQGKFEEQPILDKMNGIEIEWVKYNSNAYYKLDAAKCGQHLTISEGGFVKNHSTDISTRIINTVFATLPIPAFTLAGINKPKIAFYFEVHILDYRYADIRIGLCDQQFPLEGKYLGTVNNSIGIHHKERIYIDGLMYNFGNVDEEFKDGDMIGIGIIHKPNSKMECFATWNGQLLGNMQLPSTFANIQLFPAINLNSARKVRVNFDKENCRFKEFGLALQ